MLDPPRFFVFNFFSIRVTEFFTVTVIILLEKILCYVFDFKQISRIYLLQYFQSIYYYLLISIILSNYIINTNSTNISISPQFLNEIEA